MNSSSLSDLFKTSVCHCVLHDSHGCCEFAVIRTRSASGSDEQASFNLRQNALLVCVSLTPTAVDRWHARYQGRDVGVTRAHAFSTAVFDLRNSVKIWMDAPFDYLFYYLASTLLESVALENEIESACDFQDARFVEDLVISQLTRSMLATLGGKQLQADVSLARFAPVLCAHVLQRYRKAQHTTHSGLRGLQTWQRLRVEEMLRQRLDLLASVEELASACSMSVSHFSRRFRNSFGTSVRQYRVQLRIERAKQLLTQTKDTLAQIAQLCGFCDQAAFTRAFSRAEQMTPSRWRRFNRAS